MERSERDEIKARQLEHEAEALAERQFYERHRRDGYVPNLPGRPQRAPRIRLGEEPLTEPT